MQLKAINKLKLGIFVSISVVLLAAGIYFVGETKKIFSRTFGISAIFKDVNGLQVGNNVRFAGIHVGTVEAIEMITDTTVRVDVVIDLKTQKFIKKDAKAVIGSDGLMGNKILIISPGTKGMKEIADGDMIATVIPISMDDMLLTLKTTIDNTAIITNDLAAIMTNIHSGKGTIGKLFMDTVFAEDLNKTIVNVKQGTKGFKQNMDAAKQSIFLRGFFKDKSKPKKSK